MINKAIIISFLFLSACSEGNSISNREPEEIAENWTAEIKSNIIQTHVLESEKNSDEFIKNTIQGIVADTKTTLQTDSISTFEIIAQDTNYKYIKKRRSNGMLCFDVITLKGSFYGKAEWFRENGNFEKIGYYYNDIPCGKWKYYSSSNEIDSIINFGNSSLLLKFEKETFLRGHLISSK